MAASMDVRILELISKTLEVAYIIDARSRSFVCGDRLRCCRPRSILTSSTTISKRPALQINGSPC